MGTYPHMRQKFRLLEETFSLVLQRLLSEPLQLLDVLIDQNRREEGSQ